MLYLASNHSSVWRLRRDGHSLGWLLSPAGTRCPVAADGTKMPYAVDNGLFRAFGKPPATEAERLGVYEVMCRISRLGWPPPLWYVVPDVPYDGAASLRVTQEHAPRMRSMFPGVRQAIAVQDGMTFESAESFEVVFVAGSDGWKERTLGEWCRWAHGRGKLCHVARVNTARRMQMCVDARADSADGTCIAYGFDSLRPLLRVMAQAAESPLLW